MGTDSSLVSRTPTTGHLTLGLVITPKSDAALQSAAHVSGDWGNHPLSPSATSSTAFTNSVIVPPRRNISKRKRQALGSDDDGDDDDKDEMIDGVDSNVSRHNPNRL